jgi:hypothetical protein
MHQLTGPNIPRRFAPMADTGVLREAALLAGERLAARKTAGAWIPDALFRGRGDGMQTFWYAAFLIESSLMQVVCTRSSLQETIRPGQAAATQGL